MRKLYIPIFLFILFSLFNTSKVKAQTASWNYIGTSTISSPLDMTGADSSLAGGDDIVQIINLPFTFQVYDDILLPTNNLRFSTNGFLGFITNSTQLAPDSRNIDTIPTNTVFPGYVAGDFLSYGGNGDGRISALDFYTPLNIKTKTSGSAPNRIFTIQFRYSPAYNSFYYIDVQISFYETTNVITLDYFNPAAMAFPTGWGKHIGINFGDGAYGTHLGDLPSSPIKYILTPGAPIQVPQTFTATKTSSSEVDLTWTKNITNDDVIITYNTSNTFTAPVLGIGYANGTEIAPGGGTVLYQGAGTSFNHTLLAPHTTYYYKIWSKTATHIYSAVNLSANATTDSVFNTTNFLATPNGTSKIDLTWNLNSAGDDVIVTYNTSNSFVAPIYPNNYNIGTEIAPGLGKVLYKGTATSISHTSLNTNFNYYYKIWSFNGQYYYSSPGEYATAKTDLPDNPKVFTATPTSSCGVNLTWQKNIASENVLVVYNTTNTFSAPIVGQSYSVGDRLPGSQGTILYSGSGVSSLHSPLSDNTTYYYKAFSYDANLNYSSGVSAIGTTPLINDPITVNATPSSGSSINITWTKNAATDDVIILCNTSNNFGSLSDESSYVTGSTLGTGLGKVIYQGPATSFLQTGLAVNTTYYYRVLSYDCNYNYSIGKDVSASTLDVEDPSNLSFTTVLSCQVGLSWNKNSASDNVIVAYNYSNTFGTPVNGIVYNTSYSFPGGKGTIIYKGSANAFTHSPLYKSQSYYYKVWSVDASNNYSPGIVASTTTSAVGAPTSLNAVAVSSSQINLTWTKNAVSNNVIVTYSLNSSFQDPIDGTNYTTGNKIQGQETVIYQGPLSGFNHTGLALNTLYYYKAWSYDCGKNYSAIGISSSATTANIADPVTFTATAVSLSQINLGWTKNISNDNVIITYNLTGSFSTPVNDTPYLQGGTIGTDNVIYKGNLSGFYHTGLALNTTYYYKIWSVNGGNLYSNGITASAKTFGLADPVMFKATPYSSSSIKLDWTPNISSDSVMISYNTSNNFVNPQDGVVYPIGNQIQLGKGTIIYRGNSTSINTFLQTGLNQNTKYYYKIWSYDNISNYYSSPGILDSAKTFGGPFSSQATANPTKICMGFSTTLSSNATGGSGNYTYSWTSTPSGFVSSLSNPVVSPTVTTVYNLSASDGFSTINTSVTVTVNLIPKPDFSGLDTSYCSNANPVNLIGIPAGGVFTGNGMTSNTFNPSNAAIGGNYITYTYTNAKGCVGTEVKLTDIYQAPTADAGADISITCNGPGGLIGSSPISNMTYSWLPTTNLNDSTSSNPLANPLTNTKYIVSVKDTSTGCVSNDDVNVLILGGPTITMNNDTTVCPYENITIQATGATSYLWNNGDTTSSIIVSPITTTTYTVTATDLSTCYVVDSVVVTVNSVLKPVDLGPDIIRIDTLSFVLDAGYGYNKYIWNTGDSVQAIIVTPYDNSQLGYNQYIVQVGDTLGCSSTDTVNIKYVLGLENHLNNISFDVFPNPTKGIITLMIKGSESESYNLEITTIQGQIIETKQIHINSETYTENLDLSKLPKGVYFINLKGEKYITTKKIIVN